MSNYASLKATINANIRENNNQEITGVVLNSVLNDLVDSLGTGYQYLGVATSSTTPGTPDAKVFYLAGMGTYNNFGATIPSGYLGIFYYDSAWHTSMVRFPIGDDVFQDLVDAVVEALTGGGNGYILEGDNPKTGLITSSGVWGEVENCDSELIPMRSGTTYTLTFANGVGGYSVVLDATAVANVKINFAPGYSGQINTTKGQVVTLEGVSGQYLYVRADPVTNGRVFPVITTESADPLVVLRSEVDEQPTQGSDGVVRSGSLYQLFSTLDGKLEEVSDVLPIGYSDPPGRDDVPVSGVSFYNRTPNGGANNTRVISSAIPIPTGATGFHISMASGYLVIIYFLRQNGTWDESIASSGAFSQNAYCAYPSGYTSGGVCIYFRNDAGTNLTPAQVSAAISEMYFDVPASYLLPVASKEMAQKKISILFIGNSLTQDAVSYVPWLIRNLYPNLSFKFYMWYNSGYTLAQHYTKFTNNQACEIFSTSEDAINWQNYNNSVTMLNILSTYKFDIVCFQEYFNYKSSFAEADLVDFNNCLSYIRTNYAGNFKVATLFHAPLRSNAASVFNVTKTGNELILKKTPAQTMIAPGVAIYRALSTDLNSLGDRGGLSPDGTHTQEGLPCLLQAWVVFMWIMRQLAIPISIENCQLQMTTAIYNTINVPGSNLGSGVIQGTQDQNWLAQDVAIQGDKEGIGIEQNAFININA